MRLGTEWVLVPKTFCLSSRVFTLMSKWLMAALIWIGIDAVLAVVGLPAWVYLARAPHSPSASYWVSVLVPNILLFVVPGGLSAGMYLVIASRTSRR